MGKNIREDEKMKTLTKAQKAAYVMLDQAAALTRAAKEILAEESPVKSKSPAEVLAGLKKPERRTGR